MSRPDASHFLQTIPIAIIPIGETNSFARKWFMKLGLKKSKENDLRLLADSAMSIVVGESVPADLMKVSLIHESGQVLNETPVDEEGDTKKRGAYSLLKQNQIYALSNVAAGFATETEAWVDKYWYLGWLKHRMNRYFTDRYLRRQPVKFELTYKLKCDGCSKCLDTRELEARLDNFINRKPQQQQQVANDTDEASRRPTFMQVLYQKFKTTHFSIKETEAMKQERLKKIKLYERLIDKSRRANKDCGKSFNSKLVQAQLEADINVEAGKPDELDQLPATSIETVVVKDPAFNINDMFLAHKKELNEFELKKLNMNEKRFRFKEPKDNLENFLCLEIDGEVYKLNNRPETHLGVRVEHLEKNIKLLKHNPKLSQSIQVNYWPRVYLTKKNSVNAAVSAGMPPIKPFEQFYIDFCQMDSLKSKFKQYF